ncbi:uncharacterized protein [Battus philenor]|uniref:uncharacterized protein n=1 Tax=Battus philenor TaxID=42288 RepID=UPI0035CFB8B2
MGRFLFIISMAVLAAQVYSAPQLISFSDGKLGVNFGGYHAAVGLGGLLGNGAGGGLFAEAGTPFGQSAKAGLGGSVDGNGGTSGGLYAGATAGGNIKAAAGLAGGVNGETSAGNGYAAAQAGNRYSSSTLIEKKYPPGPSVQNKIKSEATNELKPPVEDVPNYEIKNSESLNRNDNNIPVEEIQSQQEKEGNNAFYKPNNNQLHKNSYPGFEGDSPVNGQVSPVIQKRVDAGFENKMQNEFNSQPGKTVEQVYHKQVNVGRNPTFFEDIFNIPIAALTAVKTFLTNTAGNTSISVQKSGTIHAESESISPKFASPSSATSSDTQISVKTPNASQLLDDIIAIPINTLGAVNKFLENNVPVRKRVSIENGELPQGVRFTGRHARRRALKKEIIEQNKANSDSTPEINN